MLSSKLFYSKMRSFYNLRQKLAQFSKGCCGQRRMISSDLSHRTAPPACVLRRKTSEPLCASYSTNYGSVLRSSNHSLYFKTNATLELPNLNVPFLPHIGKVINDKPLDESIIRHLPSMGDIIIGYKPSDEDVIDYIPKVHSSVQCSSVLKKRKKKMNKHKYKKRRKRDIFKRHNLENVRARKKRVKEKAEERALKQAARS